MASVIGRSCRQTPIAWFGAVTRSSFEGGGASGNGETLSAGVSLRDEGPPPEWLKRQHRLFGPALPQREKGGEDLGCGDAAQEEGVAPAEPAAFDDRAGQNSQSTSQRLPARKSLGLLPT
jgi:hypothetical protein